jgi:hypothetical protein
MYNKPVTHLFRGAPSVRTWSKYKETVKNWTLCGIKRNLIRTGDGESSECSDSPSEVSCPFCLQLMSPSSNWPPAAIHGLRSYRRSHRSSF